MPNGKGKGMLQGHTQSKVSPLDSRNRTARGSSAVARHPVGSVHVCEFWLDQLRTKRRVTIGEVAAQAVTDLGERPGVGGYDNGVPERIARGLREYVHFLAGHPRSVHYETRPWCGPYVRPALNVWALAPDGFRATRDQFLLLCACGRQPEDTALHGVAADAIQESESGSGATSDWFEGWAGYIRGLPGLRDAHRRWAATLGEGVDDQDRVGAIVWEFAGRWKDAHAPIPSLGAFCW